VDEFVDAQIKLLKEGSHETMEIKHGATELTFVHPGNLTFHHWKFKVSFWYIHYVTSYNIYIP